MASTADLAPPPLAAAGGYPERVSGGRPLPVEQFLRLRKQLPPMYLILTMNAATLAYTHHVVAPQWLSLWLPILLILACAVRVIQWMRPIEENQVTVPYAQRMLRRTETMATLL